MRKRTLAAWALVAAAGTVACTSTQDVPLAREAGADEVSARLGKEAFHQYGCITCHTIPGVRGADGLVGPPLTEFGQRGYIAGQLPNTPDNLVRWIMDPQQVEPGTAMPDLGVTQADAENMAAYLHTLR